MDETRYREFRWIERGEGEPVVLLHGLMGRMDHWEPVLEHLGDSCRAVALSLPIAEPGLHEPSVDELARYVADFLDAMEWERAVVGGNSLGGHAALALALARPERVSGLVLAGSSGLFERGFSTGVPHRPTRAYVRARMEEIFYRADLVTPEWVEAVHEVVNTPAAALRILRFARSARRGNLETRLPEVVAPTLLVWGWNDRITPPDVAQQFLRLLGDAELALLERCGHAPMLEAPEAFADLVESWLLETRVRRELRVTFSGGVR